nr:reverse transcriptase domain-containing protein [Tanacetum cinerariifolium]
MMTSEQFFGLEKDNPHYYIRWGSRQWLKKEPPRSITTWDDLVLKFINEFFPPSRTTNLRNEILNFQQKFDESFHEAWERYKDLLRACLHHGFTELHQLNTFYNALNPADQDSLNAAVGGNLLEKSPQDALTIIENKSKQFQSNPPPAQVKAVEETLSQNTSVLPPMETLSQNTGTTSKVTFQQLQATTIRGELKAIATRSRLVTEGPIIPNPPKSVNPEEDECLEETYTDPDHTKYTIKVPPPTPVQKPKPKIQRNFVLHTRDSLPLHIPYPSRMLKQKQQEKDDIQIQK